jgi:hypothetical protein
LKIRQIIKVAPSVRRLGRPDGGFSLIPAPIIRSNLLSLCETPEINNSQFLWITLWVSLPDGLKQGVAAARSLDCSKFQQSGLSDRERGAPASG